MRRIFILLACLAAPAALALQGLASDNDGVTKILLGPKKLAFCFPNEYVSSITHYNDGTPIVNLIMFLPDLSSSKVYDELLPIPKSPILQSPERIEYENSILQIALTSGYASEGNLTLALMHTLNNMGSFDHPASGYPVEGFSEYDDRWGQPSIYYYNGKEPYGVMCFGNACAILMVVNNSIQINVDISKTSIPGALDIIERLEKKLSSMQCQ